jgi:predicted nucleic acid-binding protein
MTSEKPLRVLADLNIILDVLARREPHYKTSAQVWAAIESGQALGLIAAHSVTTLFYLLTRHTSQAKAKAALVDVLRVFSVAAVDQNVIQAALSLPGRDFEDAVQTAAALQANADAIVTRDLKGYRDSPVTAFDPSGLLMSLQTR